MAANRSARAYSLKDITNAVLRNLLGTRCETTAALAIGTTTTKINTDAGAIIYTIDGKYYTKTGAADIFDLTSATVLQNKAVLTAGQFTTFTCCFDASGNPLVYQGPVVSALADISLAELPCDANGNLTVCPVGYVKIASGASAYTPGTTALTGLGTYVNAFLLPSVL